MTPQVELLGHHISERRINPHHVALRCQCKWAVGSHVSEVETTKQLHWIAKRVEAEVLGEMTGGRRLLHWRRYRMVRGIYGLAFNYHYGNVSVTIGPWVFTTEPE